MNDDAGCVGAALVTVDDGVPLVLTTSYTNATCGYTNNGTTSVVVSGGVSPYIYMWSDSASQTTATAVLLAAGSYTVTVTDANGCTATASETVETPITAEISVTATDVNCFGGNNGSVSVTILNDDPANYNFQWNDPANSTGMTVSGLSANTYTVTVTDGNGCLVTGAATVSQPSPIVLTLESIAASCANSSDGSAEVFTSGGTPFTGGTYQYAWNVPGSFQVQVLDDVSAGTYTVTVTDANGCSATGSVTIGAPAAINIGLNVLDISCSGLADGSAAATVTGGVLPYEYQWNDPTWSTASLLSNLDPGVYSITVTDGNGCSAVATAMIFEPPLLVLNLSKTDVICLNDANGTATATVNGGVSPYGYQWGGGQTSAQISGLPTGTYSLTVTDTNGCTVDGSVQIVASTTLAAAASSTNASCHDANDGSAQAVITGGSAPYLVAWSNGLTGQTINGLAAGQYGMTVTDADGCSVTGSTTVTSPPQLNCAAQTLSPITTHNGSNGSIGTTPSGGTGPYTILWSNGSADETLTGLSAGTYSATVTDANGCTCTSSATLTNPSKVGDFVWNDLNGNGLQDAGEPGIEGVTVRLFGATVGGVQVNLLTVTDSSGHYAFDGLSAGTYQIKVTLPPLHIFTLPNVGNNDTIDSDINPSDSTSALFFLPPATYDSRWDAGLRELDEKMNIGDFVWMDSNRNGLQDLNEQGIPGVPVKLYQVPGNVLIASALTDQTGKYLFTDVMPGNYFVEFSLSTLPNGHVFTEQNVGSNPAIDSDPDPTTGRTATFTVLPYMPDNLTIDAGIYKECENVTHGGLIGYNEDLCGLGADPAEIVNIALPSGGFGNLEYLWLSSTVPIYNGPGDPNWLPVPNSNSPNYDPGPIFQSTYYIRCSRREGCDDYPGETNVVAKTVTPNPLTQIIQQPTAPLCVNQGGNFAAAIAGGGATYFWDFGPGAVPANANTRIVNGVYWTTPGTKTVALTVTRFGCSSSVSTTVQVNICGSPLMVVNDLIATLQGQQVELVWNVLGDASAAIFYVQRSFNGVDFENLSLIIGKPGLAISDYDFMDTSPRLGENFYRIRYRLLDGSNTEGYSETVLVLYRPAGLRVATAYPNPTSGNLTIALLEPGEAPVEIQIWDAFGRVLESRTVPPHTDKATWDMSGYPEGMYMFSVKQPGFSEQVLKVVKTR